VLEGRRGGELREGRELDRRLRDYCAAHTAVEVETSLNAAQIGCARVFNVRDQYNDEHYAARDMTVPVLDRQSGRADPSLRRCAEDVADTGAHLARRAVDRRRYDRYPLDDAGPIARRDRWIVRRRDSAPHRPVH